MSWQSVWRGARDAAVLVPPYFLFGALFGVLAVQVGIAPWLATLASLLVLSGSAQFTMVGLLPSGPWAVLAATTGLALRHVPMSASLSRLLPRLSWRRRLLLSHVLVDETFGLTVTAVHRGERHPADYKTGADVPLAVNWVVATAVGAYLGAQLDPTRWGLDDLFPLMFIGLAAPLVRTRRQLLIVVLAVVLALTATLVVPPAWQVTAAAVAAALLGSRLHE